MRKRIASLLRRIAGRFSAEEPAEVEPIRKGLEKVFVTPAQAVTMRDGNCPPLVTDVQGSSTGYPGSFVNFPQPGDYGVLWSRRTKGLQ